MPLTSGVTGACHLTSTSIEPELQSHAVNFIDHSFDAVWPLFGVWDKLSAGVTAFCRPTVIDINV